MAPPQPRSIQTKGGDKPNNTNTTTNNNTTNNNNNTTTNNNNTNTNNNTNNTNHTNHTNKPNDDTSTFDLRAILFLLCSLCLLPFALYSIVTLPFIVSSRTQERPDYDYPQFSDLKITLYSLLVFLPLRVLLSKCVFCVLGDRILPSVQQKKSWDEVVRADRVDRFGTVCFKWLYFVMSTLCGYFILKDSNFLPPSLGGHGHVSNIWQDFPYPPHIPYVKEYYLIELGYHTQSLIFHVCSAHRSDFMEMMLHHICAIFLMVFSYFGNYIRVGTLVLLVHDIADVFAYSIKASVDTLYTKTTLTLYALLLIFWAATRFYIFPFQVIGGIYMGETYAAPEYYHSFQTKYLTGMLYILLVLHVYWYMMFLYIGWVFLKTKETKDLQQQTIVKNLKKTN